MVKGGADSFALAGGDAQAGELTRIYDGPRPHGYQPMKKQGSIILGIGGDNSNRAVGTFYEGVRISTHRSPRQARAPSAAGICLSGAEVCSCCCFPSMCCCRWSLWCYSNKTVVVGGLAVGAGDDGWLREQCDGRRRASQHRRCRLRQVTNTPEYRALKSQHVVSIPTHSHLAGTGTGRLVRQRLGPGVPKALMTRPCEQSVTRSIGAP